MRVNELPANDTDALYFGDIPNEGRQVLASADEIRAMVREGHLPADVSLERAPLRLEREIERRR